MLHTGWSSTRCRWCRTGTDRWKHSSHLFLTCSTGSSHCCSQNLRDLSPVTGTVSQGTMKNGINRLPCSYLYCSSHWIGKSMSSLHPCCCHQRGRLFMLHWSSTLSSCFELTHDAKCTKQEPKWLMLCGQSKQASKQAYTRTGSMKSR